MAVHLAQRQLKNLQCRSASAANAKARRMKLQQDNVRAVIVKEVVQLRDPVLSGALHCCSRSSPGTSSPTLNCPLPPASGVRVRMYKYNEHNESLFSGAKGAAQHINITTLFSGVRTVIRHLI